MRTLLLITKLSKNLLKIHAFCSHLTLCSYNYNPSITRNMRDITISNTLNPHLNDSSVPVDEE
ncbi:hypothetical protein VCSRO3_1115 [Vibrio cholerae]|nr:hypothetical protein VCSRO3_1115 [Vibrio cholerae]